LAFGVDVLAPAVVVASVVGIGLTLGQPLWYIVTAAALCTGIAGFIVWNRMWNQGRTGRTIGKSVAGIILERDGDVRSLGWRRVLTRDLVHAVDTLLIGLGWLRPIWNGKRQTIADKLTKTVVLIDHDTHRQGNGRKPILVTLALVVVAIGALTATTFFAQYRQDQQTAQARDTVQQVATDGTTALLSYTADTADSQLDAASSLLTGDFLEYYRQFTQQVVVPAAKEKNVNTQASAVGAAIENVGTRDATLLIMVNQITTTSDTPEPATSQSAVRVELKKVDDQWLISAFTPVF
jgi:Mce-associated membrane protein